MFASLQEDSKQEMERVQSKQIFDYQLDGVIDTELFEHQREAMKLYSVLAEQGILERSDDVGRPVVRSDGLTCQEVAGNIRAYMKASVSAICGAPVLVEANEKCIHTKLTVPPRDGNDASVSVLVHTPKNLQSKGDNPAIIYAHGGGAIGGTAEMMQPWMARAATYFGVVYFNVDYRLAPETKCPNNALDFYCALRHIIEHAAEFGVDPKRIAVAGDSGGGYIVMATMVMLAQKDDGHLVKLAIPGIPMIDDYHFGDPKSMTKEERGYRRLMRKVWECLATDLDEQRKNGDPLLFPAKADDELLAKMPPTIIWEVEFDLFITEATRMARRLRAAGRLLELYVLPGATHGAEFDSTLEISKRMIKDYKLALETYLF